MVLDKKEHGGQGGHREGRWQVRFVTGELPEATRCRGPAAARLMRREPSLGLSC